MSQWQSVNKQKQSPLSAAAVKDVWKQQKLSKYCISLAYFYGFQVIQISLKDW